MPSSLPSQRDQNDPLHRKENDGVVVDRVMDLAFITRLRDGDPSVVDTLARIFGAALIRQALRRVGSLDVAREVVQDVFLRLWAERAALPITQDIAAYLFWRTRNHALHTAQAARSASQREARWAHEREVMASPTYNVVDVAAESLEIRERIIDALELVPPRCREIFLLVWDDELPYSEVAKLLGISVLTVRNQMSRAVKHLARVIVPSNDR